MKNAFMISLCIVIPIFSVIIITPYEIPANDNQIIITSSTNYQDNYSDRQVRGYWYCSYYYGNVESFVHYCNT